MTCLHNASVARIRTSATLVLSSFNKCRLVPIVRSMLIVLALVQVSQVTTLGDTALELELTRKFSSHSKIAPMKARCLLVPIKTRVNYPKVSSNWTGKYASESKMHATCMDCGLASDCNALTSGSLRSPKELSGSCNFHTHIHKLLQMDAGGVGPISYHHHHTCARSLRAESPPR